MQIHDVFASRFLEIRRCTRWEWFVPIDTVSGVYGGAVVWSEVGVVKFGTKAQSLERLASFLPQGVVLPLMTIERSRWLSHPSDFLKEIKAKFDTSPLIVRSSAQAEDTETSSMAGCFVSVNI